jgi:hypothetical protein
VADQGSPSVKITYSDPTGKTVTAGYDLLIIACDPRGLPMAKTGKEGVIFDALTSFTFHTYALRVKVPQAPADKPGFGIILKPPPDLSAMDGSVYGFRNETAKQFTLAVANAMEENLVVVYRLWGHPHADVGPAQDEAEMRGSLGKTDWWPYGDDFEIVGRFATPYFNHFHVNGVQQGLPWTFLDLQGQNSTIYVHGSTCFESVLTCWQYLDLLFRSKPEGRGVALPSQPDASICVLGAGVSGLLVTKWLSEAGYSNVSVLERNPPQIMGAADVFGKTVSLVFDEPKPPAHLKAPYSGPTVCELGTCYMSPAYQALVDTLVKWTGVEPPRGFERGNNEPGDFRGIAVPGPDGQDVVKPFMTYVYDAARVHLPSGLDDKEVGDLIELSAIAYAAEQFEAMKDGLPMPLRPLDSATLGQTFAEFLNKALPENTDIRPMRLLDGIMEYTYSIQGYGPLNDIPAFYGLVWISADLVWDDVKKVRKDPLVTFWPGGWGQVWELLSANMNISYGVTVTKIQRAGV